MKNVERLAERTEIISYMNGLWRSEPFKASAASPGGYIHRWVEEFAKLPRLFFEADRPEIETSHFYSWFGALCLRSYENPVISDLYYLHELVHIATMTYENSLSHEAWSRKMVENELTAVLESEVLVYFFMPELRAASFDFEIWADRFLLERDRLATCPVVANATFFATDYHQFCAQLRARRRAVAKIPQDRCDTVETQVAGYHHQNIAWAKLWSDSRDLVESMMVDFTAKARRSGENEAAYRREAVNTLALILRLYGIQDGGQHGTVPFLAEAEAFAAIYRKKKAEDLKLYDRLRGAAKPPQTVPGPLPKRQQAMPRRRFS